MAPCRTEIAESMDLLASQGWDMDPILRGFIEGKVPAVTDRPVAQDGVIFHIPYLVLHKKYVLWKCHWPDCSNCCERQGRLPLTSDDLITIGAGLKYSQASEFVKKETLVASWEQPGGPGQPNAVMTSINLKRKEGETEAQDGTRIRCRFLDQEGACGIHPARPGVCYLYPFSTWLTNEGGTARVHASYQFTGDCPGFYLADSMEPMQKDGVLEQYSQIISDYNMASARTMREGYGAASMV